MISGSLQGREVDTEKGQPAGCVRQQQSRQYVELKRHRDKSTVTLQTSATLSTVDQLDRKSTRR